MVSETIIKVTRILASIILAAFVVATVVKVFWLTPGVFYPFYLSLFPPMANATTPTAAVWQIAFFEGQYLWSNRIIDTMTLAIVLVATGIGAAIMLREEPEEEKGVEK